MLSLNDAFNEAEVRAWEERIKKLLPVTARLEYLADIKMDGLACALVYEDGLLTRGITRGDGFVGEDVTANIRTIDSVPLRLRADNKFKPFLQGRTEVRGEIVMYKADFAKLNQQRAAAGEPLFANPRNTAAGTIRQLDPQLVAGRRLHFRAYDLLRASPYGAHATVWTGKDAWHLRSLVLTEPVDLIIGPSHLKGIAREADVAASMASMLTLNRAACEEMLRYEVHGCTDVTGFGLIGHAREMALASQVTLEIAVGCA